MIVVGTHSDCIKQNDKKHLEELFVQLYINYNPSQFAYPSIESRCQFVNCFDSMEINHLRELLYDKAIKYKQTGECQSSVDIQCFTFLQYIADPFHVALWTHSMLSCGPIPCCPVDPFHVARGSTQGLPLGGSRPHPLHFWMNQFQSHS